MYTADLQIRTAAKAAHFRPSEVQRHGDPARFGKENDSCDQGKTVTLKPRSDHIIAFHLKP